MPTLEILRGMPCSGKSTYCKKQLESPMYQGFSGFDPPVVISRDTIRAEFFNCKYKDYKHTRQNEEKVTKEFDTQFEEAIDDNRNIIVDNTNLRAKYYNGLAFMAKSRGYDVEYKDFHVSLIKALWRNFIRRLKTGKWVPIKTMLDFHKRAKMLKND